MPSRVHRLHATWLIVAVFSLASCAAQSVDPSPTIDVTDSAASAPSLRPSPTARPSSSPGVSVEATDTPTAHVSVDELARTTVGNLSVRTEPAIAAERLGLLPAQQIMFVLAGPVEADGYTWYQLASLRNLFGDACSSESPPFQCTSWVGWAAGITPTGDQWLEPFDPDCPAGRDTATYLSLDAVTRLACAGNDEWRLVTYLAPSGGRGCFPAWLVDPYWMDQSCGVFFPQAAESEFSNDSSIQAFIPPELGECGPGGCPFDELKGWWVEVVGHFDDPVAQTCTAVRNENWNPQDPADVLEPPERELVVFMCRLNFVVSEVTAATPP